MGGRQRWRPLAFPAGPGGEQVFLLVAQRGRGLEVLGIDRRFLLAAHLRDLLIEVTAA
jgi:hypothetical protein